MTLCPRLRRALPSELPKVPGRERIHRAHLAFPFLCASRRGVCEGPEVGEGVETAVDAQRVPGAALLGCWESGRDARIHGQADVALMNSDEDGLEEVVAQIGLGLMVSQTRVSSRTRGPTGTARGRRWSLCVRRTSGD